MGLIKKIREHGRGRQFAQAVEIARKPYKPSKFMADAGEPVRLAELHIKRELYWTMKFQEFLCTVYIRKLVTIGDETAFLLEGPQFDIVEPREDGLYDPLLYELVDNGKRYDVRKVVDDAAAT